MAIDFSISNFVSSFMPATLGSYAPGGDREGDGGDRDRYIGTAVTGGFVGLGLLGMALWSRKKKGEPKAPGGPKGPDAPSGDDPSKKSIPERLAEARKLKLAAMRANREAQGLDGDAKKAKLQEVFGNCAEIKRWVTKKGRRGKETIVKGGEMYASFADTQLANLKKHGITSAKSVDPLKRAGKKHKASDADGKAVARMQGELKDLQGKLAAAQGELANARQELAAAEAARDNARRGMETLRGEGQDTWVQVQQATEDYNAALEENQRLGRHVQGLERTVRDLNRERGQLQEQLDEARRENIELQTRLMGLEAVGDRNRELRDENGRLENLNQDLRVENEGLIQSRRELSEASGENGQVVSDLQDRIAELEGTETSLRGGLDERDVRIAELEEESRRLAQRLEVRNASGASLQGQLSTLQGQHTALQRDHERLQGEHAELDGRYQTLVQQHDELGGNYGRAMVTARHAAGDRDAALKRVAELEGQLGVRADSPETEFSPNRTLADRSAIRLPDSDLEPAGFDDPAVQTRAFELLDDARDAEVSGGHLRWYFTELAKELRRQGVPGMTNELALALNGLAAEGELTPQMMEWITALLKGELHPSFYDLLFRACNFERRVKSGSRPPGGIVAGLMCLWMHDQVAATSDDMSRFDSATRLPQEVAAGMEAGAANDPEGLLNEAKMYMYAVRRLENDRNGFMQDGDMHYADLVGTMQMNAAWFIRRVAEALASEGGEAAFETEKLMQFARTQGAMTEEELGGFELSEISDVATVRMNSTLLDVHRSRYRQVLAHAGAGDRDGNMTRIMAEKIGVERNFEDYIGKRWGVSIGGQDWALRQPEDHITYLFERERANNGAFSHLLCHVGRSMFGHAENDHDETKMYDGLARFMDGTASDVDVNEQSIARLRELIGAEKQFTESGFVSKETFAGEMPTDAEAAEIIGRIGLLADTFTGEDYDYCQRNTMAFALCLLAVDRSEHRRAEIQYKLQFGDERAKQGVFEMLTGHIRDVANGLMIGDEAWHSALALLEKAAAGEDTSPPPMGTDGETHTPNGVTDPQQGDMSGAAMHGAAWRADFGAMMMSARPYRFSARSPYAQGWNAGVANRGGMNAFRTLQPVRFM